MANKGLHFIVELRTRRGVGKTSVAIVKVPRTLPRLFEIGSPGDRAGKSGRLQLYPASTLIETELASLFPGRNVVSDSQFR